MQLAQWAGIRGSQSNPYRKPSDCRTAYMSLPDACEGVRSFPLQAASVLGFYCIGSLDQKPLDLQPKNIGGGNLSELSVLFKAAIIAPPPANVYGERT